MKEIRIIKSKEEIDEICRLLYQAYIEKMNWDFGVDNPSGLRIEQKNGQNLLVDDFTENAIWFGVFENDTIVGCARLQGVDANNLLEVERYKSSEVMRHLLPISKNNFFEMTKFAMKPGYFSLEILKQLFLSILEFCEDRDYSIMTCTHNNFLIKFYRQLGFNLIMERAFKYHENDLESVNIYIANHENGEVEHIIDLINKSGKNRLITKKRLLEALEIVAPIIPLPLYWHNEEGKVLGINKLALKGLGANKDIVGKNPYEFYDPEKAENILNHHNEVMKYGKIIIQEEKVIDFTTQNEKYFSVIKGPLCDEHGTAIGIIGTGVDITAQKQAELLKQENERLAIEIRYQNQLIMEQIKFREIINQAVHDIRSPIASLSVISSCTKIVPGEISTIISGVSKRINDIANNLLEKYRLGNDKRNSKLNGRLEKSTFQISLALQEIASEKKYEFYNLNVELKVIINSAGYLTFIHAEEASFKRMISNLINNAVEALKDKSGLVNLMLDVEDELIKITVEDNGKGMPEHIVDKIMNDISVTDGKKEGHGIGLAQVRDTLQRNDGYLAIDSRVGEGTRITLSFAKKQQPHWVAEHLKISLDDIVVILDDDPCIHKAWELILRNKFANATIKCFEQGCDALKFIEKFPIEERGKILFLADYELLHQDSNGLEIVKRSQVERSLLVTNRFSSRTLQSELDELNIKILPKLYISQVPILTV